MNEEVTRERAALIQKVIDQKSGGGERKGPPAKTEEDFGKEN